MYLAVLLCKLRRYSGTCLIRHTKGPGKCVGLYRMSDYSSFIYINRTTLGPYIFVGCHRMSDCTGSTVYRQINDKLLSFIQKNYFF